MKRRENPTLIADTVLDLIEAGNIDPWLGTKLECFAINRDLAVQEVLNEALRTFLEAEEERCIHPERKDTFAL